MDIVWKVFKTEWDKACAGHWIAFEAELREIDLPVPRHHDRHRNAELFKRKGKRADDIGQPANFGEGNAFTGNHHNVHLKLKMRLLSVHEFFCALRCADDGFYQCYAEAAIL